MGDLGRGHALDPDVDALDHDGHWLQGAPRYERSEVPDWDDSGSGRRLDGFYGPFPGI